MLESYSKSIKEIGEFNTSQQANTHKQMRIEDYPKPVETNAIMQVESVSDEKTQERTQLQCT